ncbi:alpha/beta hydrolase domain-containing protein [Actinomadura sp. 6N118]|uniref:alpha/beta hydrolase domain-containing protein n=1 Tax=Actinomadura sp. 6N118 TaxID=3375151 RepID=UPI0037A67754
MRRGELPHGDPLSWDVMTQVAASLKANNAPARPLGGRTVKRVLAMGESSFVRHWEVAGSSHASPDAGTYVDRMVLRDQSIIGPSGTTVVLECHRPPDPR